MLNYLLFSILYKFFPNYEAANICDYKYPENGWKFPFSTAILSPENYVYYLCEHLGEVTLAGIILYTWREYRIALWTFFLLHVADTVDYVLTFSNPWFDGPPTFNHLKVGIFGLTILYEKYGR